MNSVKTGSENLMLRILGKPNQSALIPIKSDSCLLADTSADQSTRFECSIARDQHGAYIRQFLGEILVNGERPTFEQRLANGDLLSVGTNVYQPRS